MSKSFGPRTILAEAELVLHVGERVGLIGANGSGKTTVLRLIAGQLEPDHGTLHRIGRPRIGLLRQELTDSGQSLLTTTLHGHEELMRLRALQTALHQRIDATPDHPEAPGWLQTLGETGCRLETLGTYDAEARAGAILQGLGFTADQLDRPVAAFSGGWRMRVALAQALFADPDLLLLDEPTNHLDLESVAWLEGFLAQWAKTLVVISHQRAFLNRTVEVIVELAEGQLTRYPGHFDRYLEQKAELLKLSCKTATEVNRRVEALERFIQRFRAKATKARQVQSRIKALEKIERVEVVTTDRAVPRMRLPPPSSCHREVVLVRGLTHAFGDAPLFSKVDLQLTRGNKIGLLGANGSGKSTLLKLLAGLLPPTQGVVKLGERVRPAYFAQHALEALQPEHSVLESLSAAGSGISAEAGVPYRQLLGGFLFSGDEVFRSVSVLSGGERARLALARLFVSGANLLLLDEPTNHLDMEARAALAEALEAYAGTLVVVSHDRDLLELACDTYWLVGNGRVTPWESSLASYLTEMALRRASPGPKASGAATTVQPPAVASRKEVRFLVASRRDRYQRETRDQQRRLGHLEALIHDLEAEQRTLEASLAAPEVYLAVNREVLTASLAQSGLVTGRLAQAMAEWEEVSAALEVAERQLQVEIEELQRS